MARQFTVPFLYKGTIYTAEVTIYSSYYDDIISIYVPDESLYDVLPDGEMTFRAQEGMERVPEGVDVVPDLFESIAAAVEAHENSKPKVGLW